MSRLTDSSSRHHSFTPSFSPLLGRGDNIHTGRLGLLYDVGDTRRQSIFQQRSCASSRTTAGYGISPMGWHHCTHATVLFYRYFCYGGYRHRMYFILDEFNYRYYEIISIIILFYDRFCRLRTQCVIQSIFSEPAHAEF